MLAKAGIYQITVIPAVVGGYPSSGLDSNLRVRSCIEALSVQRKSVLNWDTSAYRVIDDAGVVGIPDHGCDLGWITGRLDLVGCLNARANSPLGLFDGGTLHLFVRHNMGAYFGDLNFEHIGEPAD